jgi:FPC/CPF motif-containing protein YcgG
MELVEIENHSQHQSDPEPKSENSVLKRNSENGKVSFGGKRFVMICM